MSKASYHFGELKKAGCLKMVATVARRGAVEHVYAGTAQGKKLLSLVEALQSDRGAGGRRPRRDFSAARPVNPRGSTAPRP